MFCSPENISGALKQKRWTYPLKQGVAKPFPLKGQNWDFMVGLGPMEKDKFVLYGCKMALGSCEPLTD